MKNIYGETLTAVNKGATYSVDFEQRNLKVNGKYIIKNGEYEGSLGVFCYEQDAIEWLEEKYRIYKYSTPNEASEKKRKTYFKALEYEELSDDDILYGVSRNYAKCDLELLLLCLVLSGIFTWNEDMGNWFWQSKNEPDFVILRKWVERPE